MALDPELAELMTETVTIEPAQNGPGQLNKHGEFTFGAPVQVKAYITRMNVEAIDRGGRQTTSTVQAILAQPELNVTLDDRITLPDGSHPNIIEVQAAKDEEGQPYYLEVRTA